MRVFLCLSLSRAVFSETAEGCHQAWGALSSPFPPPQQSHVVINLSSQASRDGRGGGSSLYASSKGAVTTFTRAMSKELGPKGIRVNALCPGLIATRFHDDFTKDEIRKMVAGNTPLRREGRADEVGDLVVYLASDQSSFITRTNYDINGGLAFS